MKKIHLLFYILCYTITSLANPGNYNFNENKSCALLNHDAEVVIIWSIAQIPILNSGNESSLTRAVIKNTGAQTLINIPVTLKVTGINNFEDVQMIPQLLPGSSYTVGFDDYLITEIGVNHLIVYIPDDDDNSNNMAASMEENTAGLYSYADTAAIAGNFGLGMDSGYIAAFYLIGTCCTDRVSGVRVHISNDPNNIGHTVSAAIFYLNSTPISRSENVTLTAADLDKWMVFPVSPTPNLTYTNYIKTAFFQSASTIPYYPVSYQIEKPARPDAYFYGAPQAFTRDTSTGRYMIQAIMNNVVVPVRLQYFTAKKNGAVNELAWSTAQEINTKQFAIERSNDGTAFTPVGYVAAAGNSNTVTRYSFTDTKPLKGINYYRLKTVDIDGAFTISEIRSLKNDGNLAMAVYPNPVLQTMNITVDAAIADKGTMSISDMSGREIYRLPVAVNSGNNNISIDAAKISKGTYIFKLVLSNQVLIKQFNKM